MSERDALLFANEAFYQAFAEGDFKAMNDLWTHTAPVSCIHPGWNALYGRDLVMETMRAILSNKSMPPIRCLVPRPAVFGDAGMVTCYEQVGGDLLVATNVFVREGHRWLLAHHQSGPAAMLPEEIDLDEEEDDLEEAEQPGSIN